MSDDAFEEARFDHVEKTGELIFLAGGTRFRVPVDDTLEHAILEAKQLKSESSGRQHVSSTLPISQIQALIRAGANPEQVSQRYGLSEALVRRFSAAVETEKQYAIEQFLAVPAPKESRVRTLSELIERTFAAARIRPEDVVWQATRRGLEPWKIMASFTVSERRARAEWTWNMHDNAVTCLNSLAKKLIGQATNRSDSADLRGSTDDDDFLVTTSLPGDSARSARIEQAVSTWATPKPSMPAVRADLRARSAMKETAAQSSQANRDATSAASPSANMQTVRGVASASDMNQGNAFSGNVNVIQGDSSEEASTASANVAGNANVESAKSDAASHAPGARSTQDTLNTSEPANATNKTPAKSTKRRSGRSVVPSWDEILFGE